MASPQAENGHTKISNELLDAILLWRFSPYEHTVLMLIIRKTYGFNKKKDWISLSQIESATGIKQPHICRAIRLLIKQNIITKGGNKSGKPELSIQKDFDKWVKLQKGERSHRALLPKGALPKGATTVTKGGNQPLPKGADTKDTLTKDTTTKESRFDVVWLKYPKRLGRKEALQHFNSTVKTEDDWLNIQKALENYKKTSEVKRGYIKHGSTWFNCWQDYVEYDDSKQKVRIIG